MKLFENLIKNTVIVNMFTDCSEYIFEENIYKKCCFKFK